MDQETRCPVRNAGVNSWQQPREKYRPPISRYSTLILSASEDPSASLTAEGGEGKTKLRRHEPFKRFGKRLGYQKWPMLKNSHLRADIISAVDEAKESQILIPSATPTKPGPDLIPRRPLPNGKLTQTKSDPNLPHGTTRTGKPYSASSRSPTAISPIPRHLLPGANLPHTKQESQTSKKRKASVPDVAVGYMTTVQEGQLDSPTIPGHHPLIRKSTGVLDSSLRRLSEGPNGKTPRASEFPQGISENAPSQPSNKDSSNGPQQKQVPSIPQTKATPSFAESSVQLQQSTRMLENTTLAEDDTPPTVPPKSPGIESMILPPSNRIRHSACSSTSTITVTNLTLTNSGLSELDNNTFNIDSPSSPLEHIDDTESQAASETYVRIENVVGRKPPRIESLFSLHSIFYNTEDSSMGKLWIDLDKSEQRPLQKVEGSSIRNLETDWDARRILPRPDTVQIHSSEQVFQQPESALAQRNKDDLNAPAYSFEDPKEIDDPFRYKKKEDSTTEKTLNKYRNPALSETWASESSVIDRGRPTKRGDTSLLMSLARPLLKIPLSGEETDELPTGLKIQEASNRLPQADLKILVEQAEEHAATFAVLSVKDVSSLSKELGLVDERCKYLRQTHNSLRQGRKGLHARLISYLKSPQMPNFSRESILKQEEALADLDSSIDSWVFKLEQAENRRNRIHQLLLEHFTATLTLETVTGGRKRYSAEIQTPPTSPEKPEDLDLGRDDAQSIKVYADSGVTALLTAIEQEIANPDNQVS